MKCKIRRKCKGTDRYILAVRIREEMWEGAVVNQFEDFFGIFLEGVRKTTKGLRIAGDLAKIQTWYLQSRKQAYQPYRTATVGVFNAFFASHATLYGRGGQPDKLRVPQIAAAWETVMR